MTFLGKERWGVIGLGSSACKIPSRFPSESAFELHLPRQTPDPSDLRRRRLGSAELALAGSVPAGGGLDRRWVKVPGSTPGKIPKPCSDLGKNTKSVVRNDAEPSELMAVRRIVTATNCKADEVQHKLGNFQKQVNGLQEGMNRVEALLQRLVNLQAQTLDQTVGRSASNVRQPEDPRKLPEMVHSGDLEIPEVKDYQPRKAPGKEILEQEVPDLELEMARSVEDLRQINLNSTQGIQLMSTPEGNFNFPSTGLSVVVTGWGEDPLPHSSLASSTWNHQNPSHEPALVRQWPQNPKEYLSQPHSQYQVKQWNPNSGEEKVLSALTVNVVKAKSCTGDGHNVDRKLRQKLDMTEDEAHFHMKQGAFLYNFDAQTLPKSYHCFSRRLMLEYSKFSSLDSDEPFACKLNNPKHRNTYKQVYVHVLNYEAILWEKLPKFSMQQLYFVGLLWNLPPWPDLSFCKVYWMSMGMEMGAGTVSKRNAYDVVAGQSKNQFQPTRNKQLTDFVKEWVAMVEQYKLKDSKWSSELYSCRKQWAPGYVNHSCRDGTSAIRKVEKPDPYFDGAVEIGGVRLGQVRNLLGKITYDFKSCAWKSGTGTFEYQNNSPEVATPPPEFCCPISMKLMSDPVIIASGQIYEGENIERWFNEEYDNYPRTQESELIGCVQVGLKDLQPGKVKDVWVKLVQDLEIQRDRKNRGQVHLELLYCPFNMKEVARQSIAEVRDTPTNGLEQELSHSLPAHLGFDPAKMQEMRMAIFSNEEVDEDMEDGFPSDQRYLSRERMNVDLPNSSANGLRLRSLSPLHGSSQKVGRRPGILARKEPQALLEYSVNSSEPGLSSYGILMSGQDKGFPVRMTKVEVFKLPAEQATLVAGKIYTNCVVDAALFMGRSFRVGWGPNGILVHSGSLVNSPGTGLSSVIRIEKVACDKVVHDGKNKVKEELAELCFSDPMDLHRRLDREILETVSDSFKLKLQKVVASRLVLPDNCRSYIDIIERQLEVSDLSMSSRELLMHQVIVWELIRVLFSERAAGNQLEPTGDEAQEGMILDKKEGSVNIDLEALPLVSESQFAQVLNIELGHIIEACKFLDENWFPKFTLIVAQKNHRTKFFLPSSPDNVPPGTVVDNIVYHPKNYDFYMCSHAGMIGTTRPTHYHILHEEIGFSPDDLQELVHSLAYVYQRSTTAISVVAPICYAHLSKEHSQNGKPRLSNPGFLIPILEDKYEVEGKEMSELELFEGERWESLNLKITFRQSYWASSGGQDLCILQVGTSMVQIYSSNVSLIIFIRLLTIVFTMC